MQVRLTVKDLKTIPVFSGLGDTQLARVLEIIQYENHEPGVKLIWDGDIGDCVYILLDGEVEVTKVMTLMGVGGITTPEKSFIKLTGEIKPFLGELSLFDEEAKRSATVTSLSKIYVAVIRRDDFLALATADYSIGYTIMLNIARTLAQRLHKANLDILKLTTAFSLALTKR